MPQVRMQKESQQSVVELYTRLKNLLKSNQNMQAERLFDSMPELAWQDLLKYAMLKRNCPVTTLILKRVIFREHLTRHELHIDISKISQGVSRDFADRVKKLINSGQFEVEFEKYSNVLSIAETQLQSRTGKGLVNPNAF